MSRKKRQSQTSEIQYEKKPFQFRNQKQREYYNLLKQKDIVFVTGMPGTAKTLIALYYAIELLDQDKIEKIYVARPRVGIQGESEIGILPGSLEEKTAPYLLAIQDCLSVFLSKGRVDYLIGQRGKTNAPLEYIPLDYLRGRTLSNCVVIIDEAQNITSFAMYTVLSRIGEGGKIFVTGDKKQRDLNERFGVSGLEDSIKRLRHLKEVGVINFGIHDIERSPLAKQIILSYFS
jgi:phosphate starvation-inducible PhoH-like protein